VTGVAGLVMTLMVLLFRFKMGIDIRRGGQRLGKNAQDHKTNNKCEQK
jgi:hypothetical protein